MTNAEDESKLTSPNGLSEPKAAVFIVVLAVLALCLFSLRLLTPPNLLDDDQERPGTYVLDVIKNGHWMCQKDLTGDITSKPPLWTWISAVTSLAWGRVDRFTLCLPGALGAWGTAILVFVMGRKVFSAWAGFWAGVAVMVCAAGLKEFGLARTDGVFSLTVTACALAAYRAWMAGLANDRSSFPVAAEASRRKHPNQKEEPPSQSQNTISRNRAWLLFWLCAGITTLAKGPLGVLLGAGGLMAASWEERRGAPRSLKGPHLAGLAIFVLIAGGWFLMAYRDAGQALIDKMIGRELVGHVARADKTNFPGRFFYQPILYYLGRAAPWSIAALLSMWRVCKYPATDDSHRRFERFLFCWFWVGLVVFSISPHQRGDLVWPLIPAAALLAGRQLEDWTRAVGARLRIAVGAVALCVVTGFVIYYSSIQPRQAICRQTAQMLNLAGRIQPKAGEFPLTYVDAPFGLQIALNTWHPRVPLQRAVEMLREKEQVFLAIKNVDAFLKLRNTNDPAFYYLFDTADAQKSSDIKIISNFPNSSLDSERGFILGSGPFVFRNERVRLIRAAESKADFAAVGVMAQVRVTNQSTNPAPMKVSILRQSGQKSGTSRPEILLPGQIWEMRVP